MQALILDYFVFMAQIAHAFKSLFSQIHHDFIALVYGIMEDLYEAQKLFKT